MNKKKLGLLIIVLFLIIGLGSFVFANPDNQENFEKGEIEERDRLNGDSDTDDNGNTDSEKFESDLLTGGTGSQSYGNKNILFRNNLGNYDGTWFTTGSSNNGSQVIVEYDYYADALKAVQNAESSLAQGDVDYAISLIDQVTNQSQKDELNSRLEAVQDIIDVTVLIERLETMVANSTNRDGIDASIAYRSDEKIEELVTNLTNGSAKDNLANRLKTVNKILNDNEGPVISGIDNNSFTKEDVSLTISDENEVTTTVKLNDKEVDYADPFTIEGVYAVTVVDKAFNETTLTFTIDKTLPVIEGVEDGNRYTDSVTPIITDTNLASVTLNGEPFTSGATISEKGEHTLVVTDKAGNDVTVKFTVAKLATSIDLIAPESLVYDGKAKEFTAILKDENDNVLDIVLNVVYEKEDGTRGDAVNAGKYTAIVYFGGNDIYEKQYVRKSFEITKADTEFEFIAPESLMYDGTIKEYTAVLKDQHGNVIDDNYTVVYEKEDGTRGDAVNAGKYTVIAHYAGNENYNGTYRRENFEIIKATPTIELTEPTSLVYDGTAKSYGIKVIGADGNEIKEPNMVVIYRKGSETIYNSNNADKGSLPVDATSYTLGIYVRENDNYTRADKWINFEITKADTEFEFIAPESLMYDGTIKEYTAVLKDQHGNVIDDNYTVVYEKEDGTRGDAVNAGKYTVIAHYAGNENYNGTYRRENFEIIKATPTIELTEPTSLVYDGTAKSYGIKVIGADGNEIKEPNMVVIYRKGSETIYNSNNADKGSLPVDATSYTLGIYVRENDNYTRADKWINFEIIKADTEFEFIAPESFECDGSAKEYTVVLKDQHGNVIDDNYTVVYEKEDGTRGDALNIGKYTVIAHYAGNENYNGTYRRENFELIDTTKPVFEDAEATMESDVTINVIDYNLDRIQVTNKTTNETYEVENGHKLTEEGFYRVIAYDKAGNKSDVWNLTIDNVAPVITIENARESGYYNHDVVVKISDIELQQTYLNGERVGRTDTLTIEDEGTYTVYAEDRYGHKSEEVTFTIDRTKPVFEDAEATMKFDVSINVTEDNLDKILVTDKISGETYEVENGHILTKEGYYKIMAYDKAGNKSDVWNLTIDNVAPVITIENARESGYYNHDVVVKISDIELQQTYLNGERVGRTDTLTIEDEGTYTVYAEDRYGHKSEEVTFTIDKSIPTITVDKLENGVTDDGNVTVEDNGEFEVIVKYNGVEKVITTATTSKRFSISWLGEGNYEVIVTDLAGNTKTVNFELNYLNLIDQKVGANLIDEANNTINNFNSFAIKFNNDITITNYSATNGFKIEYEYSTDGKNYTKSTDTVISNYWTGALGSSTTEKYQGSTFTIKAGEPIYYSGTKVGERWNDIYEAIKSTKDTENEVYVRVVFTVIQPTYTKSFTLDPVVYSQGGYEVTPRGLAEF